MSSVITTIENDAKAVANAVSADLPTEVARLTTLLEKATTTITTQAQTIASHVSAAVASNTAVSQVAATLKSKLDAFEALLSNAHVVAPVVAAAAVAIPLVVNTTEKVANLVVTVVAQTAPVAVNAVHQALDAAIHAGNVAPTLHNLQALEAAYAALMANAGTSNSAAVPVPAQVAAIVQAAQTTSAGVLQRVEGEIASVTTTVETEAGKVVSEVETGLKNVAEGNVTIGPLHI